MVKTPFLYVALDADSQEVNIAFARELSDSVNSDRYGFKINLDSVANFSLNALNPYNLIKEIQKTRKPIFLDMKMWNGGRTMENIAKGCADLGIDIVNMYAHAGGKFIRKIAKALEETPTQLFGLTVLTHYTNEDTLRDYGMSLPDAVRHFAKISYENGAKGIIVPGTQLTVVKEFPISKLCPGVRPFWFEDKKANAQEQVVTPEEAIKGGADYIVAGSPIAKSPNPTESLERMLRELP